MNYNSNLLSTTLDTQRVGTTPCRTNRWGIILAGGDGTRLRSLTRSLVGDDRPKQFCAIVGDETLLAQTKRRAELAIPPTQILFALTRGHQDFYKLLLSDIGDEQLVVQPRNAGTAPAILYSLMRLSHLDPESTVVIFPSDHYISDDQVFMSYVESAFELAYLRADLVMLLGIEPDRAETEYGWIEPVSPYLASNPDTLSWVRRFWEKPTPEVADNLMRRGCFWNSFVMVGKVSAFLKTIQQTVPDLFSRFRNIESCLYTPNEVRIIRDLYSTLSDVNFSHEVLAARPGSLAVLPVTGVTWNDLGKPQRVLSTLAEIEIPNQGRRISDSMSIPAGAY